MWPNLFTGRERRRYIRLPLEIEVNFKINGENGEGPWHSGRTRDISLEGICLVTDLFPKEKWEEIAQNKKHLHISLDFPGEKEKITAEAEVHRIEVEAQIVWRRHKKKEEKDICLLGLKFIRIEKDTQEIIRRYIADNLMSRYRSV